MSPSGLSSTAALIAAHHALNVDTGFISAMSAGDRARMIGLAAHAGAPLAGQMEFCHVLRKNAYSCERLGEPRDDAVNGRDLAAGVFKDTQPRTSASDRAKFCAWQLMNTQENDSKVYVSADVARRTLAEWDARDAERLLVPHSTRAGAVTTRDLAAKQASINALWADSVVVVPPEAADAPGLDALDDAQRAGARRVLGSPASLLTGMGGTGKSWVVRHVLAAVQASGAAVVCLAPTHKAKYNISRAVPPEVDVSTIHSYTLGLRRSEPQDELLVVIDESSMLDIDTVGDFAQALQERVARWQLLLVGDEAQLPPVGRGECFRLAVRHAKDVVVRLTHCYRAAFSTMFDFHLAVRGGELPPGDGDVAIVRVLPDDRAVMAAVADTVHERGAALTYIAWRNADVDVVNKMVQARETGEPRAGQAFNAGDAVIYVGDNKPAEGLTNAMCGRVVAVQRYSVEIDWDGSDFDTARVPVRDVRLAYCLTVHKAQGSGFGEVCVVCTSSAGMLARLDRRWLYTAVSRAQHHVLVLCTKSARALAAKAPPAAPLSSLSFRPPALQR